MTLRAALYARVSTDRQATDDKNSLPIQRARFADWCASNNATPAGEYVDTLSGRRASRDQYQRMLTAARRGELDAVVVRHLDRFGRDQWEIMARIGELRAIGVAVEATDESLQEFIVVAVKAYAADHESKRIGERTRSALARAAGSGRHVGGRAPLGYRKVDGRLVVDPDRARVVRQIFQWVVDDRVGPRAIAVRLNLAGVPAPRGGSWEQSTVRQVLRRRAYLGEIRWADVTFLGAHEPIVDVQTWERAHQALAAFAHLPARTPRSPYLLSGLLRCGYCTGPMWGKVFRRTRSYICGHKQSLDACTTWNRHAADDLERAVLAAITSGAPPVDNEDAGADALEAALASLRDAEAEITRRDQELTSNLDLYRADALSLDQLRSANQQTQVRRDAAVAAASEARERAETLQRRVHDRDTRPARLIALRSALQGLPMPAAKAELQAAVEQVRVYHDRVEVTLT